jgi:hypothetical protein
MIKKKIRGKRRRRVGREECFINIRVEGAGVFENEKEEFPGSLGRRSQEGCARKETHHASTMKCRPHQKAPQSLGASTNEREDLQPENT